MAGKNGCRMDSYGQIRVKNPSAYWIPGLTVREKAGGTLYTVTGSYEGTGSFVRKLGRIAAKNILEDEKATDGWLSMIRDYAQLEELDRPTPLRLIKPSAVPPTGRARRSVTGD